MHPHATRLSGLIAATYTPMKPDGSIWEAQIEPMVQHLAALGVDGLYVCGSTGEGISLTTAERCLVAEHFIAAAKPHRLPVAVQVGHNSLREARSLAFEAQQMGADVVSANAPSYFKVQDVGLLTECMAEVASGAPDLPFYYYHIPHLTGSSVGVLDFLESATERMPNLAGVKYTAPTIHEYHACLQWGAERYDVLWGSDEMLLSALAVGATAAIGSTYNISAPLYRRVINAFASGQHESAREWMLRAVEMIRIIYRYPFHSAMKCILAMQGVECGQCRLPQARIDESDAKKLKADLERIGFFEWTRPDQAE